MGDVMAIVATHPALTWLALAAILLAVEVATGTGWLLWAAGSAGAVGALAALAPVGLPVQLVLFAALTIVSSLLGRRLLPRHPHGEDINDNAGRLVGRQARVVAAFERGRGRVAIDGKEWAAALVAGETPATGDLVEVAIVTGSELGVRSL